MNSAFGYMTASLNRLQAAAEEQEQEEAERKAQVIEPRFVYDYPSAMLTSAVMSNWDFNQKSKKNHSTVVVVRDRSSGKCAVFMSMVDCAKAYQVNPRSINAKIMAGHWRAKGLDFLAIYDRSQEVVFPERDVENVRKKNGHVFVIKKKTGEIYLHPSLTAAAAVHRTDVGTLQRILWGRTNQGTTNHITVRVATLPEIVKLFPSYAPMRFKDCVAVSDDPREFLSGAYQDAWGPDLRTGARDDVVQAWLSVTAPYRTGGEPVKVMQVESMILLPKKAQNEEPF